MLIKIGSALIDPEEILAILPGLGERAFEQEYAPYIRIDFKKGGSVHVDATMDEAEAALIDAGVFTDLVPDPEQDAPPVPEMEDDEVDELCELESEGFKYLARDIDGTLYAFRNKPKYDGSYWDDPDTLCDGTRKIFCSFSFIDKDDDKPTEISRLLQDPS